MSIILMGTIHTSSVMLCWWHEVCLNQSTSIIISSLFISEHALNNVCLIKREYGRSNWQIELWPEEQH